MCSFCRVVAQREASVGERLAEDGHRSRAHAMQFQAPATRALAVITRLSQLTEHRAADLLKLHGMGPRAMAILRESLADRGLALRDEEAK